MSDPTSELAQALYQAAADRGLTSLVGEFLDRLAAVCADPDPKALANFVSGCQKAYQQAADGSADSLPARVVTAQPMDEERRQQLTAALSQRFGRPVLCRFELDKSLLGGAMTYIDGLVIDGSLKGRLESLKQQITATTRDDE